MLSATDNPESPQQAQETLEGILEQAQRTGDDLLERAVYHRGIDLGVQGIVDRFLANKPKDAQAWERYTEAAQEVSDAGSFEQIFATGLTDRQFAS